MTFWLEPRTSQTSLAFCHLTGHEGLIPVAWALARTSRRLRWSRAYTSVCLWYLSNKALTCNVQKPIWEPEPSYLQSTSVRRQHAKCTSLVEWKGVKELVTWSRRESRLSTDVAPSGSSRWVAVIAGLTAQTVLLWHGRLPQHHYRNTVNESGTRGSDKDI